MAERNEETEDKPSEVNELLPRKEDGDKEKQNEKRYQFDDWALI